MIRRRSLRVRLVLSYLAVAAAASAALFLATRILGPRLFDTEVEQLGQRFGWAANSAGRGPGAGGGSQIESALNDAFSSTLTLALVVALIVAVAAAVVLAFVFGRRLLQPLDRVRAAVRRMARGHYGDRIPEPGDAELAALASDVNALGAALDESEQRRVRVVSDVAHELRTPIAALDGYLEGLEDGVFEPTPAVLATMREETRRLQRLAGDLGALSRAEEQAFDLAVEPADLGRAAATAAAALAASFADKGVTLQAGPFPELPVRADPIRMSQVFANLLRNAWEHTAPGGTVVVGGRQEGAAAVITVADDGAGIDSDHLPHIFERFYRVAPEGRAGGTGIGLTIARSIARAHGGDLIAESPGRGAGASFHVRIPAA